MGGVGVPYRDKMWQGGNGVYQNLLLSQAINI